MTRWTKSILMSVAMALAVSPMLLSGATSDRSQAAEQVRKRIVKTPFYSIFDNVEFTLTDGELVLMGEVSRPSVKRTIEKSAARVEGVNTVVSNIEVLPPSFYDDRIRHLLARQLYGSQMLSALANQAIPSIHVIVKNGHVTLEGVVLNKGQKNFAGITAHTINGVFSVTNNLRTDRS